MQHTAAPTSDLERQGAVVAGKYRLDSLLGRGGMGSVWNATHIGLGRPVAIKLVSRELVRSAEALRRFDAEAKAAARLQSRHVVQVFDNGVLEDGTPYIAMELLTGQSLLQRIHAQKVIPLDETVHIMIGAGKALSQAHAAGIVHRDIKPDNIYLAVSADDDHYLVKLLDFGIAKVAFSETPAHESTRTGALIGTPHYMSPEQARGLKTLDYRTDLYSLGLVTFTLLAGKLAFTSDSLTDLIVRICTQPLPSLLQAAPWLPPTMEDWFQRACAREPHHRFQSAQEMVDALRVAATGTRATEMMWGAASAAQSQQQQPPTYQSQQQQPPTYQSQQQQQPTHPPQQQQPTHQRMSMPNPLAPTALPQAALTPMSAMSGTLQPAGVPRKRTGLVVFVIAVIVGLPLVGVGAYVARTQLASQAGTVQVAAWAIGATVAAAGTASLASVPSAEPAASAPPIAPTASSSSARVALPGRGPVTPSAQPGPPKAAPATTKIDLGY